MEIVPWNREKKEEKHQICSTNEEIHDRKQLLQRVDGLSTTRGDDEHREVEKIMASSGGSSTGSPEQSPQWRGRSQSSQGMGTMATGGDMGARWRQRAGRAKAAQGQGRVGEKIKA